MNRGGEVRVQGPRLDATCIEGFYSNPPDECNYGFRQGEAVTLTATKTAADKDVKFQGWSDERCPSGPVPTCRLTLADAQTVVALFSPLPIDVSTVGGGMVTITDAAGRTCTANVDCRSFPLFSALTLVATGTSPTVRSPQWNPDDCDTVQARGVQASCSMTVIGAQQANVGFDGLAPPPNAPPRHKVTFRARPTGSGHGTIRGALDCGRRCSVKVPFGKRVKLVADAAAGSRFVRWKGGCGADPTCTLRASATAVAAEFVRRFSARVGRITTTGRGRRRRIRIPVRVNAPASVRAILVKGRRRVVNRVFSLSPGSRVLRLGVPKRTRAGRYRVMLTIRDRAGTSPVRVARNVRLRR